MNLTISLPFLYHFFTISKGEGCLIAGEEQVERMREKEKLELQTNQTKIKHTEGKHRQTEKLSMSGEYWLWNLGRAVNFHLPHQ